MMNTISSSKNLGWMILLFVLTGCALAATIWTITATQASESPDITYTFLWPKALTAPESNVLFASPEDARERPTTSGEATLYWIPNFEEPSDITAAFTDNTQRIELGESTISSRGTSEISIPPMSTWPNLDLEALDDQELTLAVHLRTRGEDFYTFEHLPVRGDKATTALALTLDRPLYQPGQTILMRSVGVDSHSGAPRADQEIQWQVHDPRGNLVFQHQDKLSDAGVASAEFTLSDHGSQGDYKITARTDGQSRTNTVSVQPYRMPRIALSVDSISEKISSSESLRWRVQALYTHGEPLANTDLSMRLTIPTESSEELVELRVKTDSKGIYEGRYSMPGNLAHGSSIEIWAGIDTQAGERQEDIQHVPIHTDPLPQVEIYPLGRGAFIHENLNQSVLIATSPAGDPLADEHIIVELPEMSGTEYLDLRTDEFGRATFEWSPKTIAFQKLTLSIAAPALTDHQIDTQVTLRRNPTQIRTLSPTARAGQPYPLHIAPHDEPLVLVVLTGGEFQGSHTLSPSSDPYQFELPLHPSHLGLTWLQVIGTESYDALPIWVRQQGTSHVSITPDEETYRPGDTGWIDLSFPTTDHPITFGIVGVDEALYLLQERADIPFEVLLRQAPETITTLLPLLEDLDDLDDLGQEIAASRFQSRALDLFATGALPSDQWNLQEHSDEHQAVSETLIEEKNQTRISLVEKLILSLLYVLIIFSLAFVLQSTKKTKTTLSFRIFVNTALLIVLFSLLGLIIPLVVLLFAVALLGRDHPLFPGLPALFTTLSTLLIMGCFAALEASHNPEWIQFSEHIHLVAYILPSLVIVVLSCFWIALVFDGNEKAEDLFSQAKTMLKYLLILVVLGAGSLGVFLMIFGDRIDELFAAASEAHDHHGSYLDTSQQVDISHRQAQYPTRYTPRPTPDAPAEDQQIEQEQRSEPAPQQDSSDDDETPSLTEAATIRSWFPETMIWRPEVISDAEGTARISFAIPDSITTWRINAWAHSRDGQFGEGQTEFVVTRDAFVELNLPTHLTDGDRIQLPITLVNSTDEVLTINLEATATGALQLPSSFTQPEATTLSAQSREVVYIRVRAEGTGSGTLQVDARNTAGVLIDGERRDTTVARHGRTVHDTFSGIIGEGWSHDFEIPFDAIADNSSIEVMIYPGLVADALEGLDAMLERPHGCFEQTSSINFPNILVLQLLEETDPDDWSGGSDAWQRAHDEATEMIDLGYQRMLTFQAPSGGFALYPGDRTDILLTAYGILQLVEMRKVRTIDQSVIDRALEYLTRVASSDGSWTSERVERGQQRDQASSLDNRIYTTAFIVRATRDAVLSNQTPYISTRGLEYIEENISSIQTQNTLALVANTLIDGERRRSAQRVLSRLADGIVLGDNQAYWPTDTSTWMGSTGDIARLETTAMATTAFLLAGTHSELTTPALQFIASQRDSFGGWGTTQATIWSLTALQNAQKHRETTTIDITLDDTPIPRITPRGQAGQLVIDSASTPVGEFRNDNIASGNRAISILSSTDSPAIFRATATYTLSWFEPDIGEPTVEPTEPDVLRLSLQLDDRNMTFGHSYGASATLENTSDSIQETLIVELPIPPGSYVPRDQFDHMIDQDIIDHFELLPTHIRLYLEDLEPMQQQSFDYHFIPMIRGNIIIPPLRAYRFYNPLPLFEIDGRHAIISSSIERP